MFAVGLGGGERELARVPQGSADGLALDCEGGMWVALGEGGGVARFQPDGSLDEVVSLPASFVSSICFGGDDMREVLITTADNEVSPELGGTLLRARSEVAGMPGLPRARVSRGRLRRGADARADDRGDRRGVVVERARGRRRASRASAAGSSARARGACSR